MTLRFYHGTDVAAADSIEEDGGFYETRLLWVSRKLGRIRRLSRAEIEALSLEPPLAGTRCVHRGEFYSEPRPYNPQSPADHLRK
jgi:hypothetical protein